MKTRSEVYAQNHKMNVSFEILQGGMQAMNDYEIAIISASITDQKPSLVIEYSENIESLANTIGDLDSGSLVVCGCLITWAKEKELAA